MTAPAGGEEKVKRTAISNGAAGQRRRWGSDALLVEARRMQRLLARESAAAGFALIFAEQSIGRGVERRGAAFVFEVQLRGADGSTPG